MKKFTDLVFRLLGLKRFFYFIIGLLIIQSLWFALTARYPMAFDENYHFEAIQLFSNGWSPFIDTMPSGTGILGDMTRTTSYLFHYLMSFPYRIISLFTQNQITQIIILRLINIGLFVGGLFMFRLLFKRLKISEGLINLSSLMLILIPVVPFLAATINYDNLLFLLTPAVIILTVNIAEGMINNKTIPAASVIGLMTIGSLLCLIKYAFLPIIVAAIIYLLITYIKLDRKPKLTSFIKSLKSLKPVWQISLIIGLVISTGLMVERYGLNLVKYHSIQPDCAKIQTVEHCMQNGPWARNYRIEQNVAKTSPTYDPPVLLHPFKWVEGMMKRLFFAINFNFSNFSPLPIPIGTAYLIGGLGVVLCLIYWRAIIKIDHRFWLFGLVILLYTGALYSKNLSDFLEYHQILAANGRYLIPIFPLLFILMGITYRQLVIKFFKSQSRQMIAVMSIVITILMIQGGGAIAHLVRSQPNWHFQNKDVIIFNENLKKAVSPFIYGD